MDSTMKIIYTDLHKRHATDQVLFEGHPYMIEEVPARAEILLGAIREAQIGTVMAPTDHGLDPILRVHANDYVTFLSTIYKAYTKLYPEETAVFPGTFATRYTGRKPKAMYGLLGYYAFGWGSPILEGTWEAAYWSAQCSLNAADEVLKGEQTAYALTRPPGHHASVDLYGGFCYLNNAAIATRHLQQDHEGTKVAILDVDFHHGNGTQAIFYTDPSVLYCSLHADPNQDYPYYWGFVDERGLDAGEGLNCNWPLPRDTSDSEYMFALDEALEEVIAFDPHYLVVSLGLDTLEGDPVGGFMLSLAGLQEVAEHIAGLGLPTVLLQEGGYLLDRLNDCIVTFLQAFT
jgi:acetoin utilization deacetylase AcuC-like enzyme